MSTPISNPPSHADTAWKLMLERYFPDFVEFFYPTKLIDYREQEAALLNNANLFGTVVVSQLAALATRLQESDKR